MDNLFFLAFFTCALCLYFYLFSKARLIKRRFKLGRTEYSNLIDQKVVHLYGRVRLVHEFIAPISKLNCCFYDCTAFELLKDGQNNSLSNKNNWSVLKKRSAHCNFLLEINSNFVLVLTQHLETLVKTTIDTRSGDFRNDSQFDEYWSGLKEFLEQQGIRTSDIYDKPDRAVTESTIENEQLIAVVGRGCWFDTSDYPEITGLVNQDRIYVISGSKKAPVAISNLNTILWG
ncbi:MAG: hypothetical protein J0M22_14600 [Gammaproteobacteria bacterium]|nr:hypothetical protein [Gammaproteobacteria bacterium]